MDASFLASLTFLLCCYTFSASAYRSDGVVQSRKCARAAIRASLNSLSSPPLAPPHLREVTPGSLYEVVAFSGGQEVVIKVQTQIGMASHSACVAVHSSIEIDRAEKPTADSITDLSRTLPIPGQI